MNENDSGKMIKAAISVSLISAISLIISFLKESLFAYFFGASYEADAYILAIQIPVTIFALITSSLQTIVIPNYSSALYNDGMETAKLFVSRLTTIVLIVSAACVLICEILAKQVVFIFAPGLNNETALLATTLLRIAMPTVIASELTYINIAILNVHKSFALPALNAIVQNIVFAICIVILYNNYGIYSAIIGICAGIFCECIYCFLLRVKYVKFSLDFAFSHDDRIKTALKMAVPVIIGIGAAEINRIIDKIIASFFAEGSITSLSYASKLASAVSALLITAVTTVIFPEFSRLTALANKKEIGLLYSKALSILSLVLIPIVFGIAVLSEEIVLILFQRGSFTAENTAQVAPLFLGYSIGLLFTAYRQIGIKVFHAGTDSKTPMVNAVIGIAINIVLNIFLSRFFGVLGLVIATAIATMVTCILLFFKVKKTLYDFSFMPFVVTSVKSIIASVVMFALLAFAKKYIYLRWSINGFIPTLIVTIILSFIGIVFYGILIVILKPNELDGIIRRIFNRSGKR